MAMTLDISPELCRLGSVQFIHLLRGHSDRVEPSGVYVNLGNPARVFGGCRPRHLGFPLLLLGKFGNREKEGTVGFANIVRRIAITPRHVHARGYPIQVYLTAAEASCAPGEQSVHAILIFLPAQRT